MTSDNHGRLARFETWYERELPRLFNYVSYRVSDKATAEELTAAICERALLYLDRYDPNKGELEAWVFGIARNVIRGHYQKVQQNPPPLALEALPEIEAQGKSVEEIYLMEEEFRQIVRCLHRLSDVEQEVFALRYGAGLPNQEIARVMDLRPNYVAVALHRALKKLQQAILSSQEV